MFGFFFKFQYFFQNVGYRLNNCTMDLSLFDHFSMIFSSIKYNHSADNKYHNECNDHCQKDFIINQTNPWTFAWNLISFTNHHTGYPANI